MSPSDALVSVLRANQGMASDLLGSIAGEPIASHEVVAEAELTGHPGAQGDKLIPTFFYRTRSGRTAEITVFVKRSSERGPSEAHHYAYLARHAAPIPRMYGSATDAQGREIVFLEHLDKVLAEEDFAGEPGAAGRFLALLARFNSIAVERPYAEKLHRFDLGGMVLQQTPTLEELAHHAPSGRLGSRCKQLFANTEAVLNRLQQRAGALAQAAGKMEMGLVHGDYFPRHVGCRSGSDELLTFDLAHTQSAARFFDVAPFVGMPKGRSPLGLAAEKAALDYLAAYNEIAAARISMEQFLKETRDVWLAWNLRRLGWYLGPALGRAGSPDTGSGGEAAAEQKRRDLCELLEAILAGS